MLSANAILGTVISDFCWAKSVVLLGPLMTTLGIALTIPLSIMADILKGEKKITWQFFLGTTLILGSFLGNSMQDYKAQQEQNKKERKALISEDQSEVGALIMNKEGF